MLLTMDRNEGYGRKRMFYFPYNEKAFASEFQSFLRQVVGSYSESFRSQEDSYKVLDIDREERNTDDR